VRKVSFQNVPSFVLRADAAVAVPGLGRVAYDLAYGGAFYAYVDAQRLGLPLVPSAYRRLIEVGMAIKGAVAGEGGIHHPSGDEDLGFLYGVIFWEPSPYPVHSRHVCVFAEGEVDRSPTGTGVSGRAAILHARGSLPPDQDITIESLIGTTFDVRVGGVARVGELPAVVPHVTGSAHITGRHEFFLDPDDPLAAGFFLR
jgi:trans-L-3-hydroxyproline dehydratase